MRVITVDKKDSLLELVPDSLDDLWHLEKIVFAGDIVKGYSDRKYKSETGASERKKVFLELEVEKVDLDLVGGRLRINGIILWGKPEEFIEVKAHHTIELEPGERLWLKKKSIGKWVMDRIEKARKASLSPRLVLVVLDDERADFAVLSQRGLEELCSISSGKSGKLIEGEKGSKYFDEIKAKLEQVGLNAVIAGPGFTRESLERFLKEKGLKVNAFFARVSSVGITGLNELLRKKEVERVLKESVVAEEARLMSSVEEALGKSGLVGYGLEECEKLVERGAVKELVVLDKFFSENLARVERLLEEAERIGAETHVIGVGEAGKKLESLGGIVCLLRYKIN